jgi:hypothetical protein
MSFFSSPSYFSIFTIGAHGVRPIDDRGYQYDKKWVINDKQNTVMNGNKIGGLGGINMIFMVIKLSFWANAIRPYDILQVTSLCARKETLLLSPTPLLSKFKITHGRCACLLPSNKKVISS